MLLASGGLCSMRDVRVRAVAVSASSWFGVRAVSESVGTPLTGIVRLRAYRQIRSWRRFLARSAARARTRWCSPGCSCARSALAATARVRGAARGAVSSCDRRARASGLRRRCGVGVRCRRDGPTADGDRRSARPRHARARGVSVRATARRQTCSRRAPTARFVVRPASPIRAFLFSHRFSRRLLVHVGFARRRRRCVAWLVDSITAQVHTVYQPDWTYAVVLGGPPGERARARSRTA